MLPQYVSVKNLEKYQHYKHRNPPWVKLHYAILDDPAFLALDEVQQCRYIKLIMLASRQMNCISTNSQYLAKVLRTGEHVDVTPLIDAGFLIAHRKRQGSKMLAPPHENRSQSRVEKSREEPPLPPLLPKGDDGFDQFWKSYPKKKSKGDAEKAWKGLKPTKALLSIILTAVERAKVCPDWTKDGGQFIPFPATWLRRKGWEDEEFTLLAQPDPGHDLTPTFTDEEAADMCPHSWFRTPAFRAKHGDRPDQNCVQCEAEAAQKVGAA